MNSDLIQFLVLGLVALSSALLSPFLVLKKMTMFANSLSHTSLLGVAISYLVSVLFWQGGIWDLSTLLLGALLAAFLTAFCTEMIHRYFRLSEDASIGLVFASFFALGVLIVTLFTKNTHLSMEAVLGNPDALQQSDIQFALPVFLLNLFVVALFYRPLQLITFDEPFAKSAGIRAVFWRWALTFLTSLTCIASFRAVGALVVLTMLTVPYLTVRLFCSTLSHLIFYTAILSLALVGLSVLLSTYFYTLSIPLSTSGILSTLTALFFTTAIFARKLRGCNIIK